MSLSIGFHSGSQYRRTDLKSYLNHKGAVLKQLECQLRNRNLNIIRTALINQPNPVDQRIYSTTTNALSS